MKHLPTYGLLLGMAFAGSEAAAATLPRAPRGGKGGAGQATEARQEAPAQGASSRGRPDRRAPGQRGLPRSGCPPSRRAGGEGHRRGLPQHPHRRAGGATGRGATGTVPCSPLDRAEAEPRVPRLYSKRTALKWWRSAACEATRGRGSIPRPEPSRSRSIGSSRRRPVRAAHGHVVSMERPGVVLAQQVLAVVVPVGRAQERVDMLADGGVGIDVA